MSELSAGEPPAVAAPAPQPIIEATGQDTASEQPNAAGGRKAPGAATMVFRMATRLKAPAWRVPGPVLGVALLTVAAFGVAATVYLVIPKSSGGRPAATAPVSGVTSDSAAKGGATTGGQGQPRPLPGPPGQQGVPGPVSAPQAGAKPLQPSDPGAISSWSAEGGKALAHVTTQSENVLGARSAGNYPQMLRYCTALATAVQEAENAPPIPDAVMQKLYMTSLNALKQGSADCIAGITEHHEDLEDTVINVNHAEVDRAMSELGVGANDLYIATDVLRRI